MYLFNENQINKIESILNLDQGCIIDKLYKKRKDLEKKNISIQNRRPSWSSNTIPEKKTLCSYPVGTEESSICKCIICDDDYKSAKKEFLEFRKKFSYIKDIDELDIFEEKYKDFIGKMLSLQLTVLRSEINLNKWDNTFAPIKAAIKFKKLLNK